MFLSCKNSSDTGGLCRVCECGHFVVCSWFSSVQFSRSVRMHFQSRPVTDISERPPRQSGPGLASGNVTGNSFPH